MTQDTQSKIQADRLAILVEAGENFPHYFETFDLANVLSIIQDFEPTKDLQSDVQRFLSKLELAHSFVEFSTAEQDGDDFKAHAKRLVDEGGSNVSLGHAEAVLPNL
jgi:hypothetical protein